MGSSVTVGHMFKLKHLTREYGAHSHGTLGRLSVAGTVPDIDVYMVYVMCHSYKLALVKALCRRSPDYDFVKSVLKKLIYTEVEVIPLQFVIPRSHQSMHVNCHCACISCRIGILILFFFRSNWTFVGNLEDLLG
ncbi:unnamed protein product [Macrosiphum euphorbiae]|uniref:Uncharacterized protein n=1 Tax=Macrosiphum euphorbiae TaxID=13131 RepID=A0AAV0WVA2_9HEMI|nr:unnamed protein product [Macrosiphum euphorbiae]